MNERQTNQIEKIVKDLDKILESNPELKPIVNVVRLDYNSEVAHLKKYFNESNTKIEQFIHYYLDRVKSLYELIK